MSLLRSELLEMRTNFEHMQQIQLERFEYVDQKDEQRQLESAESKELMKLILERLNTQITLPTERTILDRRSADLEQPLLDEPSINLQQTETKSNLPKSVATPPKNSLTDEEFYSTLYIDNKNKNNKRQSTDMTNPDYIVNKKEITTTRQRPPVDFSLTKITVYKVVKYSNDILSWRNKSGLEFDARKEMSDDVIEILIASNSGPGMTREKFYRFRRDHQHRDI